MAGIDNLTPFQPGNPGNPKGRGKGTKNRSTILRELAALKLSSQPLLKNYITEFDLPEDATLEQAAAASLLIQVLKGDVSAIKEFSDTMHGKLKDTVQTTHTFSQMGQIKVSQPVAGGDDVKETAISFNVGSAPSENLEDDEDDYGSN